MVMFNPRFPHKVIVRRESEELDDRGKPLEIIVLESICGIRNMDRDINVNAEVINADYKLALPKHGIILKRNDKIELINHWNGEVKKGYLYEPKEGNLGANIWFNENRNG